MKTHFKKLRNPNFVGSWDLVNQDGTFGEMTVTVTKAEKSMVHDGKGGQEECPIMHFKECKPMVMNSTNLKAMAKITGSNFIEDWYGKQITLFVQKVKAFGDFHDALRIKAATPKAKPTLTDGGYKKAIDAIKGKTYTKEQLISTYSLTKEQTDGLQNI